jgi:hypothetical protein
MSLVPVALTIALLAQVDPAESQVFPGVKGKSGLTVHRITSPYQSGETGMRVLLPDELPAGRRLPVVYVLPVEEGNKHAFGDGIVEAQSLDLHNKYPAIFVAPSFSQTPWFCDHDSDPLCRQESHFLKVVVPAVERLYPVIPEPRGRLLLGFSKSGCGACSLLLRHPDIFGRAAAWDAPLMMNQLGIALSKTIFGTDDNFNAYRISDLLRVRAKELGNGPRLIVTGWAKFKPDVDQAHELCSMVGIPHVYRDGPRRKHEWNSGWFAEAVELLLSTQIHSSPSNLTSPGAPGG